MLEQIRADTLKRVQQRQGLQSLEELQSKAIPTHRSLARALGQKRSSLILECKKASPSQGLIRPQFDIAEIIHAYDPFADAISVITNPTFFQGDLSFLNLARVHTQKPLLCKDFVLTPYQVLEARTYDADAILLMMSLLDDSTFQDCFKVASSLNMDVLVEVHDEEELERALGLGAQIIGVNNRDFKTLKVDLSTAQRVLPKISKDKITVFESGISTHHQLLDNRHLAQGFLIGTSLMKQLDLPKAVRELVFGRVKVCGLTRIQDAQTAFESGASYGGLIFAPESPRHVELEHAREIHHSTRLNYVGVFVNQPVEEVARHAKELHLYAVQLHGEENADYIRDLRQKLPQVEIWKAVRVQDTIPDPSDFGCDRVLLDAFSKDKRGGTGQRFDWSKLKGLDAEKYILSGGLAPANAREADEQRLWALDVNSGVESSPGIKSTELLQAFFQELR